MPTLSEILSGGASGVGTGAALGSIVPGIGTGIGAAIGGGLGVLGGIFGGGRDRESQRQVQQAQSGLSEQLGSTIGLRDDLRSRYNALIDADPRQTGTYQAGRGALRDMLADRQRFDTASAAARGLTGTEFEIAQSANRGRSASDFLRNLLGQSEQMQQRETSGVLSQLLGAQGMASNLAGRQLQFAGGQQEREDRRRGQNQSAIAQAVMNALLATRGAPGGGS